MSVRGSVGYLDAELGERVYDALVRLPLKTRGDGDGMQPLRDLDSVRGFLSSGGPSALFDLPWMPLYLGLCFYFHFWIGVAASVGAVVLIALAILTEFKTRNPTHDAAAFSKSRMALANAGRRNAEALRAMGMGRRVSSLWNRINQNYLQANERASDVASGLGGLSKVFRTILQSAVLAVGAFLVIKGETTAGIIIASSILSSRALGAGRARDRQLERLCRSTSGRQATAPTPDAVAGRNRADGAAGAEDVPERRERRHHRAGRSKVAGAGSLFQSRRKGQGLGIIGPSGSGKSTLARALVGAWPAARGRIRIDDATFRPMVE